MFAKPRGMHQVCDFYGGKTMCVTDFYNSKMFFISTWLCVSYRVDTV